MLKDKDSELKHFFLGDTDGTWQSCKGSEIFSWRRAKRIEKTIIRIKNGIQEKSQRVKKNDGTYSAMGFIKRALRLWSLKSFNSFKDKYFPNAGILMSVRLFIDAIWCSIIYKTIYDDYFDYRFWEKSHYSRKRFVTKGKARKIQKIFNKKGSAIFTYNKLTFNKEYSQFKTTKFYEFPGTIESFIKFVADCNYKI